MQADSSQMYTLANLFVPNCHQDVEHHSKKAQHHRRTTGKSRAGMCWRRKVFFYDVGESESDRVFVQLSSLVQVLKVHLDF